MVEVSELLIDALAPVVAEAIPVLAAAVPVEDAAVLGRRYLGDPFDPPAQHYPTGLHELLSPVLAGLPLVPPRELVSHPALALDGGLVGRLEELLDEKRRLRLMRESGATFSLWPVKSDQPAPGSQPAPGPPSEPPPYPLAGPNAVIQAAARALAVHPRVAPLLVAPAGTEPEMAAAHGAAHLALCLAVSLAVHRALVRFADDVDLGRLLSWTGHCAHPDLLMYAEPPPGYDAAVLTARRAGYTYPGEAAAWISVRDNGFALVEGFSAAMRAAQVVCPERAPASGYPDYTPVEKLLPGTKPDFAGNGLVALVGDAAVVRTGADHSVQVGVEVRDTAPDRVDAAGWDEIVEISWAAREGLGTVLGAATPWPSIVGVQTPPWAGDYRLRVHARGRQTDDERHQLIVWPAPDAPEIVHKLTDDLGRRLRGEPEPPRPTRPVTGEWLSYDEPATLAVAAGGRTVEEVLDAYGADPDQPVGRAEMVDAGDEDYVLVHAIGEVVLTVEPNGWQGSRPEVLRRLSERGRAASWYYNVNALTTLSFARDGVVLASFEPGLDPVPEGDAEVAEALAGFGDEQDDDPDGAVLRAIERFTGFAVYQEDGQRVYRAEVGYRIVPRLDDLRPTPREPSENPWLTDQGPLGADSPTLVELSDEQLRDLAWWVAAEVAAHYRVAGDPAIAAALAERRLSEESAWLARRGHLSTGEQVRDTNIWGRSTRRRIQTRSPRRSTTSVSPGGSSAIPSSPR